MKDFYHTKTLIQPGHSYIFELDNFNNTIINNLETLYYNDFAERCVKDLKDLQEKFQAEYDLDWYTNWFYNQTTGLLTFNTGDAELNFKYFDVGSFSEKSNTWNWSWNNNSTLENAKKQIDVIKEFGLKSNFTKLTNGYFPSDEFEAWEFAAIAAKLTNGIGVYRPVNNDRQLQIFLVITESIDKETAQNIKNKYVQCNEHEYRRIALVCKHLNRKKKIGFHEAFETSENMELSEEDDFQAWCGKPT